jgi:hypothetical protein
MGDISRRHRIAAFAALLLFTWHFAATLFLIFAECCLASRSTPRPTGSAALPGCRMRCG